jgi:two-component system LytT family response regulator
MFLRSVVIDKDPAALEIIKNYIGAIPELKLLQTFDDVLAGGEFLRNNKIDLLFIEAGLPGNSAINLIRSLHEKLLVIFTLGCQFFSRELLEFESLDYLVKPFTLERFAKAAVKAINASQTKSIAENPIYIRSTYQLIRINLNEIEYIESAENYIKVHLSGGKIIMSLIPLKTIIEKLPPDKFVRIHRSYIISVDKIKYVVNKKIKLSIAELPVSDSYLKNFNVLINK